MKSFIEDYKIAAIANSSKFLLKEVLKLIPNNLQMIIEQGAGDGVMSEKIVEKLNQSGNMVLIEQNEKFLEELKELEGRESRAHVWAGLAQDFPYKKYLEKYNGGKKADAIISSIPFSFLSTRERHDVVRQVYENLADNGKFVIFHQYRLLMEPVVKKYFTHVKIKFVIFNLFPCFIIVCQK